MEWHGGTERTNVLASQLYVHCKSLHVACMEHTRRDTSEVLANATVITCRVGTHTDDTSESSKLPDRTYTNQCKV